MTTHTVIAAGLAALADQAPIQAGAMTPHRTFDGDGFRIRQLAFDAGAVLAEHTAPVPIIIQIACGAIVFEIDGQRIELAAGAVLHVAAGAPHQVTATEPTRLVVTLLG